MARRDRKNTSVYVTDPEIPGVSVLAADFTNQEYAPHSHEALVVATTDAGGAAITSRGASERASAAELFVFNPAEPHSTRMAGSRRWRFRSIYLAERGLSHVAALLDRPGTNYFTCNVFRDADLIGIFRDLQEAFLTEDEAFQKQELLASAFGQLFQRHGADVPRAMRKDDTLLRRISAQMRDSHGDTLELDALAQNAGISVWQLIGLFKRGTGLTPHAYLTQIRLSAACRYLRRRFTIAEAAAAAGFYDQSSLTKHFKRSYGMTPLQFAASHIPAARNGGIA
jgi:AraC-like DNA-binding protein